MAYGYAKMKLEHSGAKNGGGSFYGRRHEAKEASRRRRRRADKTAADTQLREFGRDSRSR